jgi:hypothetical protein
MLHLLRDVARVARCCTCCAMVHVLRDAARGARGARVAHAYGCQALRHRQSGFTPTRDRGRSVAAKDNKFWATRHPKPDHRKGDQTIGMRAYRARRGHVTAAGYGFIPCPLHVPLRPFTSPLCPRHVSRDHLVSRPCRFCASCALGFAVFEVQACVRASCSDSARVDLS